MSSNCSETTGPKKVISPLVLIESLHCVSYSFEYMQFIHSFICVFVEGLVGGSCFGCIYLPSGSLDSEAALPAHLMSRRSFRRLHAFGGEE